MQDLQPFDNGTAQQLAQRVSAGQPLLWTNPARAGEAALTANAGAVQGIGRDEMEQAARRFWRFAPALTAMFPELASSAGVIESPLLGVPALAQALGLAEGHGRLLIKADHTLPVAGSIKARGGIHEVLEFAEGLAGRHGLVRDDHAEISITHAMRQLFASHEVSVGSTGNLGLSVGVMAAALGFRAVVHMSAEAKAWKKKRLRDRGVTVVEHAGDYGAAVEAGRQQAMLDPNAHFVDDEHSTSLFMGYSAAVPHLAAQLAQLNVQVDAAHPLFVYIPCGVGGAPGGIAYGLAHALGPHVHCFFVEPVQSPCFLVAMAQGQGGMPGSNPSVYDLGLTNRTEADGLAVARASELAASLMRPLLAGIFTVQDHDLFDNLGLAHRTEGLRLEPSAAAAIGCPMLLVNSQAGQRYLQAHGLAAHLPRSTHIVWTTGGLFVPEVEYQEFLRRAAQ